MEVAGVTVTFQITLEPWEVAVCVLKPLAAKET